MQVHAVLGLHSPRYTLSQIHTVPGTHCPWYPLSHHTLPHEQTVPGMLYPGIHCPRYTVSQILSVVPRTHCPKYALSGVHTVPSMHCARSLLSRVCTVLSAHLRDVTASYCPKYVGTIPSLHNLTNRMDMAVTQQLNMYINQLKTSPQACCYQE